MANDVKDFNNNIKDWEEYNNVRANTDKKTNNFATYLINPNKVTIFNAIETSIDKTKLFSLCGNTKIKMSNTTYFNYAGVSSGSEISINIKLDNNREIDRVTKSGVVFGIKNKDFNLLTFNADHKRNLANDSNSTTYNKNFEDITTDELLKYVCDKFSMNDLLVSMRGKKVISHLIYAVHLNKLNFNPNNMGLTGKQLTAKQLRDEVIKFLISVDMEDISSNFNDLFNQIENTNKTIYELELDYISKINSELFEIFSAYDLLYKKDFNNQNYKVYFPKSQITSLYDYELIHPSNTNDSILVSVKNNISVNKNIINNIQNNANKQHNTGNVTNSFTINKTKGNTLKPSVVFENKTDINIWRIWTRLTRLNKNHPVYTSDINNQRVYRIFTPAVVSKSSLYTIDAIKNLGLSNGETGKVYITNYFERIKRPSKLQNDKFEKLKNSCIGEFIKMVNNLSYKPPNGDIVNILTYNANGSQNTNITETHIQIICEKILEYNSRKKGNLKAENKNDNTNFVDVASYLVNRNKKKVIFSTAKYKKKINDTHLEIYFQHVMADSTITFKNTWIPLRSQGSQSGSLLGMDLDFSENLKVKKVN